LPRQIQALTSTPSKPLNYSNRLEREDNVCHERASWTGESFQLRNCVR
jgi:hypothetical protein